MREKWRQWLIRAVLALVAVPGCAGAQDATSSWQIKLQSTFIIQHKPSFDAPYTGTNSILPQRENSRTATATMYLGVRPWAGGELHLNPEMALGVPISELKGVGGFTNGEIARTSGADPSFYRARLFLRQTWGLGGDVEPVEAAPNQLSGSINARRVVVTAGNVSALDIFDANKYSHEPRRSFMNWSLMTQGAWDYPADARGFTWGAALEYITPDWAVRAGRFMQPKESNGLPLNSRIMQSHGDVVELERGYQIAQQRGRVRVLAFQNHAIMGAFSDALALSAATGARPDLSLVRTSQSKRGGAINIEQDVREDVGLFMRASAHDGRTETYAFTEIDRSLSGGVAVQGRRWQRAEDQFGIAMAINGLSPSHRNYLAAGGLGFFLGDGRLNYETEKVVETFYSLKAGKYMWVSLDYQHIRNPGYNADRGPANFFGVRLHVEN